MNHALSIVFAEDYFVCSIFPNESAWESLKIDGTERLPLYFYVSGGNVRNDAFSRERFERGDEAAFGNFYETILDEGRTFRRFDLELEPIQLLQDVIRQVKSAYSERMQAFDGELGELSEIRVNLCFVPGVKREARQKLRDFLVSEGLCVANEVDYLEAFVRSLQRKAIVPGRVNLALIETSFGDLWFHYLWVNDGLVKRESEVIVGKGVDYRVGNLARLLVEKAARQTSSRIMNDQTLLDQEIKSFHPLAQKEIANFQYDELDLRVTLSDHASGRVIVDRRELDRMGAESFAYIKFRFESFISNHSNLARTEKILLNGSMLSSAEYMQFFERTFGASKVVRPFDNFLELLSRGIFALVADEEVETEREVEIKITVRRKGVSGAAVPERPPVPPAQYSRMGSTASGATKTPMPPARSPADKAPPVPPARTPAGKAPPVPPAWTRADKAPPVPPARTPAGKAPPVPPARTPAGKAPPVPPARTPAGKAPPVPPARTPAGKAPPVPPARTQVTKSPPVPPPHPLKKVKRDK